MMSPDLRPASGDDARLLWEWVNDPTVRQSAFQSDPIVWADHVLWLETRLASPVCRIYIAESGGEPVAQVRFDLDGEGCAEIDVSVAPEARGRGIGTAVVRSACTRAFAETGAHRVLARVKLENTASQRMFAAAGFADRGQSAVCRRHVLPHPATEQRFVVAAQRPWNRDVFDRHLKCLPGAWTLVTDPEELTAERLAALDPRYVFFLHWSSIVPPEITDAFTCVGFHMTDLPYGRGGSPLQNLIARGHTRTKLSAFAVEHGLDTGAIYAKADLDLSGSAREIYVRASELAASLIRRIIAEKPSPVPQAGEAVVFARRTPAQSELSTVGSPEALYDFVRMLDADGYPRAFLVHEGFRYELSGAELVDGAVRASVSITPVW
jgi:methionyl-tRNA formyltransferase